MKNLLLPTILAGSFTLTAAALATAQTADPTKAYIDAGFALMDANKDGQIGPAEFDGFMRARLARQAQKFDAAFAELDANGNGKISKAESTKSPDLAANFAEVDANSDGGIDKVELQTAAAQAQMQEAGLGAQ